MAMYIPVSRRRRNAALVAIATLVVGLVVGLLVGRSTAVTAPEAAATVRSQGDTLGTRIEALEIEYKQAIDGTGDSIKGGVLDALDIFDVDLNRLIADAPWLGSGQINALRAATTAVRSAAESKVSPDDFNTIATASAKTVRDTFGVDG